MNKEHELKFPPDPQYLRIADMVEISLKDGSIKFLEGYNPDEVARQFWEFIESHRPKAF